MPGDGDGAGPEASTLVPDLRLFIFKSFLFLGLAEEQ